MAAADLQAEALSKAEALGSAGAASYNRPLSAEELSDAWVLFDWNSEHRLTVAKLRRASAALSLGYSNDLLAAVFRHLEKIARARREHKQASAMEGLAVSSMATPSARENDNHQGEEAGKKHPNAGDQGNEQVGFAEFVVAYDMSLRTARFEEARPDLLEAFRSFDTNGDGQIDLQELSSAIARFSPLSVDSSITEEDCASYLRSLDVDGDGKVNYEEFANKVVSSHLARKLTFKDLATTTSLRVRECFIQADL